MNTPSAPSAFERAYAKKWSFLALFTFVYFLTLVMLSVMGVSPLSPQFATTPGVPSGAITEPVAEGELPLGIEIPSIGIKASVANPASSDIGTLDKALLGGAVRYPGSGIPGEEGNVLMFGHSSHLPVVHNQAYKAFNDIQNLKEGAPIYVVGETKVYVYAVETVSQANTSTGEIPLAVSGAKLTLATCDNFGSKSDRFIVTAKLVSILDQAPQ